MVCASLRVRSGVEVNKACRSAMLHYRSPLLETLMTLTMSPLMVLGQTEEKQSVIVELFSDFEEDQVCTSKFEVSAFSYVQDLFH